MFIEREDILQQIELRKLEGYKDGKYAYKKALQQLGRRNLEHFVEDEPVYDKSFIVSTRARMLLALSCRLYRITDPLLRSILCLFFFSGLSIVEIGKKERIPQKRMYELLRRVVGQVE